MQDDLRAETAKKKGSRSLKLSLRNQIDELQDENKRLRKTKPKGGDAARVRRLTTRLDHLRDEREELVGTRSTAKDADASKGMLGDATAGLAAYREAQGGADGRQGLVELLSKTLPDSMTDIGFDVAELQKEREKWTGTTAPAVNLPDASGAGDNGLADLLKQQLDSEREKSRMLGQQFAVFSQFAPIVAGRIDGRFLHGARELPRDMLADVHQGETVLPSDDGPFRQTRRDWLGGGGGGPVNVELHFDGNSGQLVRLIDARVNGRVAKVSGEIGRKTRIYRFRAGWSLMARVLVAKQAWGVQFRMVGDRVHAWQNLACTIDTTVYAASTGGTPVSSFTTNDFGELPGWVEEGTYNLTVNGVTTAVSTTSGSVITRMATAEADITALDARSDSLESDQVTLDARTDDLESGHVFAAVTPNSAGAAAANTTAINAALTAAAAAGGGIVHIARLGDIYTNGGHDIPPGVQVWGLGYATRMVNRGATWCFRLKDETADRPTVGLKRIKVVGSLSGVAAASGGIGVEVSNGYGFDIDKVWVDGFSNNGVGWKFHNIAGTIEWTGGHSIRHVAAINCSKCVQFIAEAAADEWFGEIDIDHILIQPSASQVGISYGLSHFYNSRISGSLFYAGNNAIGIEIATAGAKVRQGSFFDLRGEIDPAFTGCKRIKMTAAGQFDASGKIVIANALVPDDLAGGGVFNFVEAPYTYYEAVGSHNFAIASASTISIPGGSDWFELTGTTTVNVINTSWDGRVVTLKAAAAVQLTVAGNIKLNGGVAVNLTADDQIMLACRSGVWRQVAPVSVN